MSKFNQDMLAKEISAFVADDTKMHNRAVVLFANVFAFTIRTGNNALLSMLDQKINGSRRLHLNAMAMVFGKEWWHVTGGIDSAETAEVGASVKGYPEKPAISIFGRTVKDGMRVGTNDGAKALKSVLIRMYGADDDKLAAALLVYGDMSAEKQDADSKKPFDLANYLKGAIDKVIKEVGAENPVLASDVADSLNNVIKAKFGRDAAYDNTTLTSKVKDQTDKAKEDIDKARKLLEKHGMAIAAPAPALAVDNTPAEAVTLDATNKALADAAKAEAEKANRRGNARRAAN